MVSPVYHIQNGIDLMFLAHQPKGYLTTGVIFVELKQLKIRAAILVSMYVFKLSSSNKNHQNFRVQHTFLINSSL